MTSVFDLGGHVGIKYCGFKRLLHYPDALRWTVCDGPGVVQTGSELAKQRGAIGQLGFTTDYKDADCVEVLFVGGGDKPYYAGCGFDLVASRM